MLLTSVKIVKEILKHSIILKLTLKKLKDFIFDISNDFFFLYELIFSMKFVFIFPGHFYIVVIIEDSNKALIIRIFYLYQSF